MPGRPPGFFSVPPVGAGVWIEFEAGDVSRPIWAGCFWGTGELPMKPPGSLGVPTTKIWRSELGLTAVLDDATQTITLSDAARRQSVEISVLTGTVTVKGAARVVNSAARWSRRAARPPRIPACSATSSSPISRSSSTLFNTHVHPGELAAGILPVTPAPPVAPDAAAEPEPPLDQSDAGIGARMAVPSSPETSSTTT